jgi:hypothetical protein
VLIGNDRKIKPPEPALLFIGALYSDAEIFDQSKLILTNNFGDILFESPSIRWDYSSHYKDELGWPILKQFIFFKKMPDPGTIADIKLKTNEIEDSLSLDGKRRINLDPGYLTLAKIVLASTKNYSHRIYLKKGIYGEVTLIYYKDGTFKPHLFTYRDYQDKASIDVFLHARATLKKMLSASEH